MAIDKVKKVTVLKNDLPPINADNNSYYIRYRVVSKDGIRSSHWSPINTVPGLTAPAVSQISLTHNAKSGSNPGTVTAVWTPPSTYDIETVYVYVKWEDSTGGHQSDWKYVAKVSTTSYAIVIPDTVESNDTVPVNFNPKKIYLAVQEPTYPKVRSIDAQLFESNKSL